MFSIKMPDTDSTAVITPNSVIFYSSRLTIAISCSGEELKKLPQGELLVVLDNLLDEAVLTLI